MSFKSVKVGHSTVGYTEHEDHIELYSVRTPAKHRGKGHASAAIKHVTDYADKKNKSVKLMASPLDKKTKTHKLVSLYKKHGFELTGDKGNYAGDPIMHRKPKLNEDEMPVNNISGGNIATFDPLMKKGLYKRIQNIIKKKKPKNKHKSKSK